MEKSWGVQSPLSPISLIRAVASPLLGQLGGMGWGWGGNQVFDFYGGLSSREETSGMGVSVLPLTLVFSSSVSQEPPPKAGLMSPLGAQAPTHCEPQTSFSPSDSGMSTPASSSGRSCLSTHSSPLPPWTIFPKQKGWWGREGPTLSASYVLLAIKTSLKSWSTQSESSSLGWEREKNNSPLVFP